MARQPLSKRMLLDLASAVSLGVSLLLAWVYALSRFGLSCPSWDPRLSIVLRAVVLPLGYEGALLWTLLLLPPVYPRGFPWLAAPPLAFALALFVADPLPLALLTVILAIAFGARKVLEALPAGVIVAELAVSAGFAASAYGLRLPLLSALPLHFSLYCLLVPAMPVLALLACLSPLLAPLAPRSVKLSAPFRDKPLLALGLLASLLMWSIIYASALNPGARLVGVDAVTRYYPHALKLLEGGLPSVLKVGYDRPLHYLLLYGLAKVLGPYDAVRALALTPLLLYTAASYLLAKKLWGGRVAGLAAFAAPLTYTATAGLFGGLYGNWTALSVALLAYAFLIEWLKGRGFYRLAAYFALMLAAVAIHVYVGAVVFATSALTLALAATKRSYRKRALTALAVQLALAALGLQAAEHYFSTIGVRGPLSVAHLMANLWLRRAAAVKVFSEGWWSDFCFAVYRYAPTAALDPTVWLLTATAIAVAELKRLESFVLLPWMAVTALLAFTAPSTLIWRALYDFPYSIAEALGLAYLATVSAERFRERSAKLCVAALLLYKLSYALAFAVGLAS